MRNSADLPSAPSDYPVPFTDQLRLAVAAYLARFQGSSRCHTESDLRCYLTWCAECGLDPLAARRPHLELYIRWMQEIRGFKPSTVLRRFSVTAGFYRTCVIDDLLNHSPALREAMPYDRSKGDSATTGGAGVALYLPLRLVCEPNRRQPGWVGQLSGSGRGATPGRCWLVPC